ncbi:hypothetical protein UA08_06369 [Talaromyces atroroseus]|uniref:Rhodopsin domain-containing protein n=1 Tax=Talaromyces atroroseus TaxID=1441469 RepID=A0A225AH33_TALAT|nr:hypothetical protein UA08_06369 [Talaromyces atroroseus]OKL58533.1 hypothetical protein UA08_06369 [Talaromyces atroroseus]
MSSSSATSYCGQQLIGVSIAIAVIQILVVGARFYTRYLQQTAYWLDDYLIVLALISCLGQTALYLFLIPRGGIGYHLDYVEQTPQKLVILDKGLYANEILDFPFTVTPAKISILLFYTRIFTVRSFCIFAYIVGATVLAHGIGVLFAAIFQCSPIAYTWDKAIPGGSCFDQQAFYRYVSPPNILTDVLILVMPLPSVWKLHTRVGQKVALTGVFLLGSLGTVASILRMATFFLESATTDPTWASVELGIWTILEGGIVVVAACLPTIWPLVSRFTSGGLLTSFSPKQTPQQQNDDHCGNNARSGLVNLGDSEERIVGQSQFEQVESDPWAESLSLTEINRTRES